MWGTPLNLFIVILMEVFTLDVSKKNADMVDDFPVVKSDTSDAAAGNMTYLNGKLYSFNSFWASPDFIDKWLQDEPAKDKAQPDV